MSRGRSTGTQIRFNQILGNGGLGIDLGPNGFPDGITPNDPGDVDTGPNELQNYPEITSVIAGNPTRITGRLDSQIGLTYVIDFYASPESTARDKSEGRRYLGSTTVGPDDLTFDVQLAVSDSAARLSSPPPPRRWTTRARSQGTSGVFAAGADRGDEVPGLSPRWDHAR